MAVPRLPPKPCRVLVVESSPELRRFMALLLEGERHQVTTLARPDEAATLLRTANIDVVITDSFASSPDRALESVRDILCAAGSTPVVLCTGHRLPIDALRRAGVRDLIPKPFDPDIFLA